MERIRRAVWGAVAAAGLLTACETGGPGGAAQDDAPALAVEPSTRSLLAGEIATLTAAMRNTTGRNTQVEWTSTGGDVRTEDNGSIARVYFPRPGLYTVTAALLVDGREVDRDSVNINVKPVTGR